MKHFKNLAISYLHACGMVAIILMLVLLVGAIIDREFPVFEIIGFLTGYTIMIGVIYLLPAYLIIGTPYYFEFIIKRPWIQPRVHYTAICVIVSTLTLLAYTIIQVSYGGSYEWQILIAALLASATAITGMRTLIKRTKQEA